MRTPLQLLQALVDEFDEAIQNEEPINGGDAVEFLVPLTKEAKEVLTAFKSGEGANRHMFGHYHATFENGDTINEKEWWFFVEKVSRQPVPPISCGVVCTFGCGRLHPMSASDYQSLLSLFKD